jgi:Mor family transcriptional regulator
MGNGDTAGFLEALANKIAIKLQSTHHIPHDSAAEFGMEVADEMRRLWGGLSVYICKNERIKLKERQREVYDVWLQEGFSPDLCRKFGLTEQRIRQIIKSHRIIDCESGDSIQ